MNCPTYHCAGHSPNFHIKAIDMYMKAYICDKLTSFVNDVKGSNAVVSEFMNEVYDIVEITIFDFTVP